MTLERIPHLCEANDYPIFGELQQSANILMMNINNGTRTRLFVKNLLPYTGYIVRVSAINDAGGSPLSEGLCVSTLQSSKDTIHAHTYVQLNNLMAESAVLASLSLQVHEITCPLFRVLCLHNTAQSGP